MKRQIISKIFAVALVVIIISAQVVMPASAAPVASKTASFTLKLDRENSTYDRDETVFATFVVNTGFKDVNGFDFSINYDTNALTYAEKSISFPSGSVSEVSVYSRQIAGVLNIAWESDKSVSIPDGSTVFTLRFKVNSDVKDSIQATTITVKLNSMYTDVGSHVFQRFDFSAAAPTATVLIGTAKTLSEVVADAINAIGTVELTDECKSKIEYAVNLYYSLPLTQRSKVAESQILFAAMEKYEELLQDSKDGSKQVATEYLAKYKDTIDIPLDKVSKSDLEAVKEAFNELRKLSLQAQARLMTERTKLAAMLEKIAKGDNPDQPDNPDDPDPDPTDPDLPDDPDSSWNDFIKEFRTKFNEDIKSSDELIEFIKDIISKGTEGVNVDQSDKIIEAINKVKSVAEDLASGDETRKNYGIKEVEKIFGAGNYEKLLEILKYLEYLRTSEMVEVRKFLDAYEGVLNIDIDDLQPSDRVEVFGAYAVFNWLSSSVQSALNDYTKGRYGGLNAGKKLGELFDAMLALEDITDEDVDDEITTDDDGNTYIDAGEDPAEEIIQETIKTINKNKVIYKTGAGNYILKLARREIGAVVWVLFCLLGLSAVIFATLRIVYYNVNKSKRKGI